MTTREAARRCGNTERAKVQRDVDGLSIQEAYEDAVEVAAIILGVSFGFMFFVGLIW